MQSGAATLASFTYDGLGNRLAKTAGSTTTSYLWDENASLPQLAEETSGATVLRSYVYGSELVSMTTGGGTYYTHTDGVGSVVAVTSASGQVETTDKYDPFGNKRSHTNVDPNAPAVVMQFTGQLLDPETGLYDLRARLYDPVTGRFLSTDPLPEAMTDPAMGDYVYAGDQVMVMVDPSGESMICNLDYCKINLNPGKDTRVFLAEVQPDGSVVNVLVAGSYTPPTPPSSGSASVSNTSRGSSPAPGHAHGGTVSDTVTCQGLSVPIVERFVRGRFAGVDVL